MVHLMCLFRSVLGDEYARTTGYNEVGELNNIIIIYPQTIATNNTNPHGCWDFWGYTNGFYSKLSGLMTLFSHILHTQMFKQIWFFCYFLFISWFQSHRYIICTPWVKIQDTLLDLNYFIILSCRYAYWNIALKTVIMLSYIYITLFVDLTLFCPFAYVN